MTEEQNDQTAEQPASSSEPETAPTPVPETTGQAIALPATTPPPPPELPQQPTELPQQPDTPPMGLPQGSDIPQGTYAMGALAGNPILGDPTGRPYAGPPTNPGAPMWPAPPAPGASAGGSSHHVRNGVLAGIAAFAVLAAGVGIGHAAWNNNTSNLSATGSSGSTRLPSGSGSSGGGNSGSSGSPFGNGAPFGGGFSGSSGNSGNTGSGSSGSSGSSGPSDASAIAAKVDPGLVDINTTLGYAQEQAAGTGIVLTSSGVILTNNHVIDGATTISVTDVGNKQTYTASVVGYDRTGDVAVLQLHNASGLTTANLGNSSNVSVGQDVVGIGNAGGTGGTPSAAGGTVTALNQSITASDEGDGTSEQLSGLIETNANIQPGDSGGALVNTSGQVLGMDTAASAGFSFQSNDQSSGSQGYAIPINTALNIAKAIEAGSSSTTVHIGETAFLGVEISPSGNSSGSGGGGFFGGNSGNTGSSVAGASVAGVVTNGPAQTAGLAQGDTITSLGGKSIGSADALTNAISEYHPGDKVQVGWTDSSGQTHTATVQLSSGPPQ
ncbi:MAG: S1C family serine protease [Acidimicrobiales bacterium]